jgi:hypothetical protein
MRKIMCRDVVTLDKFTLCNIRRQIATLIVAQLTRASALRRFTNRVYDGDGRCGGRHGTVELYRWCMESARCFCRHLRR